jgi:amidase
MILSVPDGLMEAFWAYERALMSNDLKALDGLFAPDETTLRADASGLLVGHDRIREFRNGRGGAPRRTIVETHVRAFRDDHALIVAVTELATGGRGQQTQLWERRNGRWVVAVAHVAVPSPVVDTSIWRVVGDPLVAPTHSGGLDGHSVAVKDLFAVAGQPIGAGNPAWLAEAEVQTAHAWAVQRLLAAGAAVRGIARTDEFAYSLAGTNAHYGAPPNPKAPYRIPGGSSSGPASAVSLGHATIGLGTDTGGSIRVPAAYQGLWGIRTTHGAVQIDGLLPLAPTFDTVGWLTRDASTLAAVGAELLPADSVVPGDVVAAPELTALADADVAESVSLVPAREIRWPTDLMPGWLSAMQTLQASEAWAVHGPWLSSRLDTLGTDIRARFAHAASITDREAETARRQVAGARVTIRELLADKVIALPSTSSVAPPSGDAVAIEIVRQATMLLTCIAGVAGLPAVSFPSSRIGGPPIGVCLVGPAGSDRGLLDLAAELSVSQ